MEFTTFRIVSCIIGETLLILTLISNMLVAYVRSGGCVNTGYIAPPGINLLYWSLRSHIINSNETYTINFTTNGGLASDSHHARATGFPLRCLVR